MRRSALSRLPSTASPNACGIKLQGGAAAPPSSAPSRSPILPATEPTTPTSDRPIDSIIDRQEASLGRQLDWIRAVDGKTPLILGLATALLGAIAAIAPAPSKISTLQAACAIAAAIPLLLSLVFCVFATFPRTDGPADSLLFFGCIARMALAKYQARVRSRTDDEYLTDLVAQTHRNAQIAHSKYASVRRATLWLFVALPLWLIAGYVLLEN